MKEWIVIHKIKSLFDNGHGMTERQIAKELGLPRNTVSKYLHMPEADISDLTHLRPRWLNLRLYHIYAISQPKMARWF